MHRIKSEKFFKALEQASTTHQFFATTPSGVSLNEFDYEEKRKQFENLLEECRSIGLASAAAVIERAIEVWCSAGEEINDEGKKILALDKAKCGRLHTYLSQATSRIPDDLSAQVLIALDTRRSTLFEELRPFGDVVFNAFPAGQNDLEEAAKCLALERGTACVFHLMRALESAASVIAAKIGATIKDLHGRSLPWGVIAENMKPRIDIMPAGSDLQIKWYRVQQDLVVVNRAWRVPTSHPRESYTPDEAQEVFDATRAFMKELAPLA